MHTQLAKQLRKLAQGRSTEGSTLTEMLIAGTITLAVVGASGIGVVAMVNNEQIVEAQTEQRAELNRSMDFIASEVQLSDSVEKDASSYSLPAALTSALPSEIDSTITPVLILKKDSLSNPVIYYSATPTGDTWNGPQIIYRWGPSVDVATGDYGNTWESKALIDKIDNSAAAVSCPTTDWKRTGTTGFQACVDPTGKQAQIFHVGDIKVGNKQDYSTSVQVAARSSDVQVVAFAPPSGVTYTAATPPGTTPTPGTTPSTPSTPPTSPFSLSTTGSVKVNNTSTIKIEFMGGQITCGAGGVDIPTAAQINLRSSGSTTSKNVPSAAKVYTFENVAANTTVDIDGIANKTTSAGGCRNYYFAANSASGSQQVIVLKNGDTLPNYQAFGNQNSIGTFLASVLNPTTRKITLAANEVVYLYELGSTNPSQASFDMQDMVVRATITPTVTQTTATTTATTTKTNCNKGGGNGSEGCDPGNNPNLGNDDETVTSTRSRKRR